MSATEEQRREWWDALAALGRTLPDESVFMMLSGEPEDVLLWTQTEFPELATDPDFLGTAITFWHKWRASLILTGWMASDEELAATKPIGALR